ncbi:hypothetical protein [Bauldia sp.]|uniref:hypothetical protein n=1 Tax=Bauldia sp. TaxID=2575872 RepID=UPI003BA9C1C1
MAKEWTLFFGLPGYDFIDILQNALLQDVLEGNDKKVVVGNDTYKIIFKGDFEDTDGEPGPESGTVEKITLFAGAAKVAKATGLDVDVGDLGTAIDAWKGLGSNFDGILGQFFGSGSPGKPVINGSDDREDLDINSNASLTFYGNGGNDRFVAGGNKDKLLGGKGKDKLKGERQDDVLKGNAGKDKLFGGEKDDTLVGGPGKDKFVFDVPLGPGEGQAGVDTIKDFEPGKDMIGLDSGVFAAIGGKLNAGEFHQGGNAQDGNDHILYKKSNGKLFHDDNGDGAGGRTLFAILEGKPNLSHTDFDVI